MSWPIRNRQAPVPRPQDAILLVTTLATVWLSAAAALAADLAAVPAPVTDSSATSSAPTLFMTGGGFLRGHFADSDEAGVLRWRGDRFTEPFRFPLNAVSAIHFPAPAELPKPEGEYCFELIGGDTLFGSLVSMSEETVVLESGRIGRFELQRDQLRRLFKSSGVELIYIGPTGLTGWTQAPPTGAWREDGGRPFTGEPEAVLHANLGLPAQCTIELELSWIRKPDFAILLGTDNLSIANGFSLEVWESTLVAMRSTKNAAAPAAISELSAGAGRLHLLIFLDQMQGRMLVTSPSGEMIAELHLPSKNPKPGSGVRITNKSGDVRLERLRISRWDGARPREADGKTARVTQADGTTANASVIGYDSATRQFTLREGGQTRQVAAGTLSAIHVSSLQPKAPHAVTVMYQDGTRLGGKLARTDSRTIQLEIPGGLKPMSLPLAGLSAILVTGERAVGSEDAADKAGAAPAAEAESQTARTGVLQIAGSNLPGTLLAGVETSDASCLVWKPRSSLNGSALRPGTAGRIVYREPPPPPPKNPAQPMGVVQPAPARQGGLAGFIAGFFGDGPQPAGAQAANPGGRRSLHLRSGDTIPCEVERIDEEGITFRTPLANATFVKHDLVKAVELVSVTQYPKLKKAKKERLLTLPRMQRDRPPTHLVCFKNGDFLRGYLTSMDERQLELEIRLETKKIPRDRIAQVIWLHKDELGALSPDASAEAPSETPDQAPPAATRVQALQGDGNRLTFTPSLFDADSQSLGGRSVVLGDVRAQLASIDQLLIGDEIDKQAADLPYHRWRLHHAPDPKFVQEEGKDGNPNTGTDSPLVGKPAPDFELEMLDGKKFHLADQIGHVVVLDFWATWCGPCLQAMPQVERAVARFEKQGIRLVAVNLEESPKQVSSMMERHNFQMPVALDRDGVVATKYQASSIPQTVLIDSTGKVSRVFVGVNPQFGDDLQAALQALFPNAEQ